MSGVTDNYGLILPADGEAYNVDILNQNNIAIDALIKERAKQAEGVKVRDIENTSDSGAITTEASLASGIASFAFKGGRKYWVSFKGNYYVTNVDTVLLFKIGTCAVLDAQNLTTGVTVLDQTDYSATVTNRGFPIEFKALYEPPADTTLQIKVLASRVQGTGNIHMQRSAVAPNILYIEDAGAQY